MIFFIKKKKLVGPTKVDLFDNSFLKSVLISKTIFRKSLWSDVFCFYFLFSYSFYNGNQVRGCGFWGQVVPLWCSRGFWIEFFFFFFKESLFLIIAIYHQTNTPINFWYRRELNLRSLIQPSEILPIELTGIHILD